MSTNLGPVIKDDEVAQRCVDALCATYGYRTEIDEPTIDQDGRPAVEKVPNKQTPLNFARDQVESYVLEILKAHEQELALTAARATVSVPETL